MAKSSEKKMFRASCVKVDITPDKTQWLLGYGPRQSDGIHDNLYHRIVAMDNGEKLLFLISSDHACFSPFVYDEFCKELEQKTGIKSDQIWWMTTHTHGAPEVGHPGLAMLFLSERYIHDSNPEYTEFFKDTLLEGIIEAQSKLEPAKLGIGKGSSMANVNRRQFTSDGKCHLGINAEGAVDRQIGLIRLDRLDGTPIALIANYAMHGTVLGGGNCLITADAPGVVAEYVESKIGAPMLFINGAEGNVAPIYSTHLDFAESHIDEFKTLLGDKILDANQNIKDTSSDITLWTGKTFVETPKRSDFGWVDNLKDYLRINGQELVRIPVYFLRINLDTIIWGAPLELFCEVALNVRASSPYQNTFYFGLTNGTLLYLPTKEAFAEGGYEPSVSPFTENAEEDLTKAVIKYIHDSNH
ncbi:TPA: hypothetical protein ENS27_11335 [bacterium]|nr:hypothetical protein [bacterium]